METLLVLLAIAVSLVTAFVAAAVTLELFLRLVCRCTPKREGTAVPYSPNRSLRY